MVCQECKVLLQCAYSTSALCISTTSFLPSFFQTSVLEVSPFNSSLLHTCLPPFHPLKSAQIPAVLWVTRLHQFGQFQRLCFSSAISLAYASVSATQRVCPENPGAMLYLYLCFYHLAPYLLLYRVSLSLFSC